MADSYNKKERAKKKAQRKKEKAEKKAQRRIDGTGGNDIVYVDENGNFSSTPPDPTLKEEIALEDIEVSVPRTESSDENPFLKQGKVKFFNYEKGYGFIQDSRNGDDFFVHIDNVDGDLRENDKVEFEVGSGPKGPIAIKVKLI